MQHRQRLEQRQRTAASISDGRWDIFALCQRAYEPVPADAPAWPVRLDTTQSAEACGQQALAAIEVGRPSVINIRVILVAIDFSDLSPTVMDYACSLAVAWQARLLVVHVVHDLSYFTGMYHTDTPLPELQQRLEAEAHERLEALCQSQLGTQVPCEALVVTGRPMVEIHHLIRQHEVDCLVIGAHSTDKPEHQLFGSTAERLLHHISCPIFMIPPRQASEFISRG